MLEVSGLTRSYGKFLAVDDVNFAIGKGEIVGLLGHNGAGKTTIMKMLSGYLEPDRGQVMIDGHNLADDTKAMQRNLGYLPESLPIYQEMSVADYLDYAAELKGLTGEAKRTEIRYAIQATEITERLLTPIAKLSRGLKQRVGVAQAILGKPRLLILDEPTNGLDPTQTEHMRTLIRNIAKDATVILSTHIMQEVEAICDRVLIVRAGKLAVDARLDDLRASNSLLVSSSMQLDPAKDLLQLPGVEKITMLDSQGSVNSYRLSLGEAVDGDQVSAEVAKVVIEKGYLLYQLRQERQDLETLFRNVNAPSASTATHSGVVEGNKNAA